MLAVSPELLLFAQQEKASDKELFLRSLAAQAHSQEL